MKAKITSERELVEARVAEVTAVTSDEVLTASDVIRRLSVMAEKLGLVVTSARARACNEYLIESWNTVLAEVEKLDQPETTTTVCEACSCKKTSPSTN